MNDSLGIVTPGFSVIAGDTLSMDDAIGAIYTRISLISRDTLQFSDFVRYFKSFNFTKSDTLHMLDALKVAHNYTPSLGDSLSMSDHVTLHLNTNLSVVVHDTLSMNDFLANDTPAEINTDYIRRYLNDVN